MAGKGDKRRPTDEKRYADNYDAIFRKDRTPQEQEAIDKELKAWGELTSEDNDQGAAA